MKKIDYCLGEGITSFSTLRDSESYSGKYNGFNSCHYVNDSVQHVDSCRKELVSMLGIPEENLIVPTQIHSPNVEIVDRFITKDSPELDGLDALVTDLPAMALVVHTADCVPVLMSDPVARVVAAVHGGWRGLVAGILENTVANMINVGAKPRRILAQMGPHISSSAYEVGEDILSDFADDEIIKRDGKNYIDLSRVVINRLEKVGVPAENINDCQRCTFTEEEQFFSARREGKDSGRMASVIMINP